MKELKHKILRYELIDWKKLKPFQPDDLKKTTPELINKLKISLLNNKFANPFYIWQKNGTSFCIDGHHRLIALNEMKAEGIKIPTKLPGIYLDIKNDKEAKKMILAFTSHYAELTDKGMIKFFDNKFDKFELEFEIPRLNFETIGKYIEINEFDEWKGMPEFEVKDESFKIIFHFDNEKIRQKFIEKYEFKILAKTKAAWSTWYPFKKRQSWKNLKYE